ncbi:MAG: hypothetical protein HQK58_10080 [Deltaproteobacteria bacterium]|nr:hypothetical protein [Deltaproteobacteria bacterium]MBF0524413.1 hypothetical protein [Deltaproteobacteria bacterium]
MNEKISPSDWIWVVIGKQGQAETMFGIHDAENDVHFIPIFKTKDEGLGCLPRLSQVGNMTYELQATRFEMVQATANEKKYYIYMLGSLGEILHKIPPE